MSTPARLVNWRPLRRGKLFGFATVELPIIGLTITEVAVLRGPEGPWATLPGKPEIDRDNRVRTGADGRPVYRDLLTWRSRRLRQAFSERVVGLVRTAYPDDLMD